MADRRNITQPPDWWAAFEREADQAGLNMSEWIGDVCWRALPERVQRQLSFRKRVGRPKLSPHDE